MTTPDILSLVESVPACNCSGADDGAWGLAPHSSNCATIVARLRRFHVGHQIASGKGEVICVTCHMELLSTQDDALADARYDLTRLRAELAQVEKERDQEKQRADFAAAIEDGATRRAAKAEAELVEEKRKVVEYRPVPHGEAVQDGDEFYNFVLNKWMPSERVGETISMVQYYRRPLAALTTPSEKGENHVS